MKKIGTFLIAVLAVFALSAPAFAANVVVAIQAPAGLSLKISALPKLVVGGPPTKALAVASVSKLTSIGGKDYYVLSIPEAKATQVASVCVRVETKGWTLQGGSPMGFCKVGKLKLAGTNIIKVTAKKL